jgi:hypothetical protein
MVRCLYIITNILSIDWVVFYKSILHLVVIALKIILNHCSMKLLEYFKEFLNEEVNLNATRIKLLDKRTVSLTNFLKDNVTLKDNFKDIIPQGSYAHKTIIRPVKENNEFDADLLLYLEEFSDWDAEDYVENIYKVFRDDSTYRNMVSRQTRCVTIDYAGDFHVDIVPYLERYGSKYVTNRHENNYELTNPEQYNVWLDEKHRTANRHLVKVVRLVKYLRDFKGTFSVKSTVLNVLLANQVNNAALLEDDNCYQDVSTTLKTVMNKLSAYLYNNSLLPSIIDPSGTGENLSERWSQDSYSNFRNRIIYYAEKINDAYAEPDKELSLEKWQIVFGDSFKAPVTKSLSLREATSGVSTFSNTEQKLLDIGIVSRLTPYYKVRVEGRVLHKKGFREYNLSEYGNKVQTGRDLRFSVISCNVPEPYQVYWKVLNRGEEAKVRNCIRGTINRGNSTLKEVTSFAGPHFVECFIVKDGFCVARDLQSVLIF